MLRFGISWSYDTNPISSTSTPVSDQLVLHSGADPANVRNKRAEVEQHQPSCVPGCALLPCTGCSPHRTITVQPASASSTHRLGPQTISCLSFHCCHDNIAGQNFRRLGTLWRKAVYGNVVNKDIRSIIQIARRATERDKSGETLRNSSHTTGARNGSVRNLGFSPALGQKGIYGTNSSTLSFSGV